MILSTFLIALANIISSVINIYVWVIIIAALISWVSPNPFNPIVQLLHRLTQPVYEFIRRFMPTVFGGIDLAPIIVLLALQFINQFLVRLLFNYAATL